MYAGEYIHHLSLSFDWGGRVIAIFALAIIPFLLFSSKLRSRTQLACLAAGGVGIMLFFALDQEGFAAAGEFRFLLYSVPLLSAGMVVLGYVWQPKIVGVVGLAALALQLSGAVFAVERSSGPSSQRNFVENYNAPLVFPLKSLVTEARQKGMLAPNAEVLANQIVWGTVPGVEVTFGPFGELYCECTSEHPNVLPLFVRYTNLNAGALQRDRDQASSFAPYPVLDELWRNQLEARPMCLAKLRKSCAHVLERVEAGETVAALGTR